MKLKQILLIKILISIFLIHNSSVFAVNLNSPQYTIQAPNINIGGKKQASDHYSVDTTLGQLAANEFHSNGYIVKAGFQYIRSVIPFTFYISKTNINLGTLLPNTPKTDNAVIRVSFGAAGQYTVTAIEETLLKELSNGYTIPNTTCDSGTSCSKSSANIWSSPSSYGFGYNMDGKDIPVDFGGLTYFRPFPDRSATEDPEIIMTSSNVTLNITPTPNPTIVPNPTGTPRDITHEATITFKANISPIQAAGSYQAVINFVATPSF